MHILSVGGHYRAAQERIREEVRSLAIDGLDGTTTEEWVDYFMRKYAFPPIVLREESPVLEQRVTSFPKRDPFGDTYEAEVPRALIGLPVEPNPEVADREMIPGNCSQCSNSAC